MIDAIKPTVVEILKKETEDVRFHVEIAIEGYAEPRGCGEWCTYVLFRIWNAVKSIFGCSDWQKAVNAMTEESLYNLDSLKDTSAEVKTKAREFTQVCSDKRLHLFIGMQNGRHIS